MTVAPDGRASVQAGAGIVADSDPASENAECAHKAAAMLSAVAMARAAGPAGGHGEPTTRRRRLERDRERVAGRPGGRRATCLPVTGPDAAQLPPGSVQPGPGGAGRR